MSPTRTLHLLNHWPGGGVESVVECLVEAAVAAGEPVRVAVLNPCIRPSEVLSAAGVQVVCATGGGWNRAAGFLAPPAWLRLRPAFREALAWAEVVQAHHPLSQAVAARLAAAYRFRLVAHVHNMGDPWMNPGGPAERLFAGRVRAGLRAAERIVCVGGAVREAVVCALPDVADRAVVVPNPLPAWLASFPRPEEPQYDVVVVGRLDEQKNSEFAARVIATYLAERPGSRAAIVGDGPLAGAVDAVLAEFGVSDRVDRLGWLDRRAAVAVMADSRVLLQPSRYEGSPITVREALALGLHVAASDIPPHRELAEADPSATLVPTGSPCPAWSAALFGDGRPGGLA